jgi:hypothetical protein
VAWLRGEHVTPQRGCRCRCLYRVCVWRCRRFLESSDHSCWSAETADDSDICPDAELLFWKRRLQKLSAITEQVVALCLWCGTGCCGFVAMWQPVPLPFCCVAQVKLKSTQHVLVVLSSLIRVTPPPAPTLGIPLASGKAAGDSAARSASLSHHVGVLHLPERTMITEALRRWKDLDVELTEATNEVGAVPGSLALHHQHVCLL